MTEEKARRWLSSHHDKIPALELHHRKALEVLDDRSKTVRNLADVIALDPGMSVSLYHEVNGKLHQAGKQEIESVHTALGLLGDSAIADLVMQHPVLSDTHPDAARRQSYHQLVSRSYHLLAQLDGFISTQGVKSINEVRSAGLLHNIGEFCACLFDHEHYRQYQEKFRHSGADVNAAREVFDFDFHEVGRIYAEKSNLPPLVTESLDENVPPGRKARLIQLAADVSHQAEVNWYSSSMKATEEVCAAYLNQSVEGFDRKLQQVAIAAARDCPFDDVLPAAARLIMLPETERSQKPAAAPATPVKGARAFDARMQTLVKSPRATQAQVLDLLLTHLHDDLHLSRVVLLLISADKTKLGTRAGKGLDENSPIRKLVVDISKANLLRSLLAKQQAIWLDPTSYRNFEASLPSRFKAAFLHEDFFLMSLFVGKKPIGLIFADRAQAVTRLDKPSYVRFKSAVMLASKALTFLARRRQRRASA